MSREQPPAPDEMLCQWLWQHELEWARRGMSLCELEILACACESACERFERSLLDEQPDADPNEVVTAADDDAREETH